MKNALNWFEIPTKKFEESKAFYETVFETKLETMEMKDFGSIMAFLPSDSESGGIGGSIISGPGYEPSDKGSVIYLNGGNDLSIPLKRAEEAGATVVLPKTSIGANGFIAQFIDPDGNKVAFHSMK